MKIKERTRLNYKELSYGEVTLEDAYCINALKKEKQYLLKLEPDRLLAGFRENAGLKEKAKRYPGWEVTEIQGHTLGHYLSAVAQVYGYDKEEVFRERIHYMVSELKECQREDGFLFAWPEEIFDRVENHKPAWVPWYTMHKIFEGLLLAYELADEPLALEVLKSLGNWVYERSAKWDAALQKQVLSVEYGGMNDCLYELYQITGEEKYHMAAHKFDELPLFEALQEGKDVLNGLHANTTIPKIVGAFQAYSATGEENYLETAEQFFDIVRDHHTYITGGNSEWEHFGEPDILDAERTACNCETCNTYNMLKLAKGLFAVTGKKKYADFYERTWTNAILSSQNPETGMTMYFQPMATGFFKVYSTPFDKFWCCTGTGMENFSKLHEGIYFRKDNQIYVNRFVSSKVDLFDGTAAFSIQSHLPEENTVTLTVEKGTGLDFYIRVPEWQIGSLKIQVNGAECSHQEQDGYAVLKDLKEKDIVELQFAMEVRLETLPDNDHAVAFAYGPVVLSAKMGTDKMETGVTGVDVTVPHKDVVLQDYLVLEKMTIEAFKRDLPQYLVREQDKFAFALQGTDQDEVLEFVPHYSQHKERYGIYWTLYEEGSEEIKERRAQEMEQSSLEQKALDLIPVGNDQYELSHQIRGYKTDVLRRVGTVCRFLKEDGWISYRMKVAEGRNLLKVKYNVEDTASFGIYIEGELLAEETHKAGEEGNTENGTAVSGTGLYERSYEIPAKYAAQSKEEAKTIEVKFENREGSLRFYDKIYIQCL